jgi:starch phosphorylase
VADLAAAGPRERFEAFAHAVRDVLSHRWLETEDAYTRQNPKRVYYLSMEFLIGRSLANNVTNLLLDPIARQAIKDKNLDWVRLLDQEPDAGLGNGGLGRLAACFLDSMATMQLPAVGYGLRYEYGMFKQTIRDGWQQEQPDNWLRHPDPWEVVRRHEKVEVKLNSAFEVRDGRLRAIAGRPSTLIGMPYHRPVAGHGGKTINTLRLWAATAPDYFDFQVFSHGDFVAAVAETLVAESLTGVLYPDDSTRSGQELRFVQEYFLVACSLADLIRRFRRGSDDWRQLPEKAAIRLNDTHPSLAVPELMRILLDDAHLGWDHARGLTQQTLAHTNHTLLPEALEKWQLAWFEMLLPCDLETIYEINRRLLDTVRSRFLGDDGRVQRDGATIEMAQEAGEENFFLFGLTADQVTESRGWYSPHWHYDNEPETRAALDLIFSDHFSRYERGIFGELRDALFTHVDFYIHTGGPEILSRSGRLVELYRNPDEWTLKAILNVAGSGKFSSDRTIAECAADIWQVKPCPVS